MNLKLVMQVVRERNLEGSIVEEITPTVIDLEEVRCFYPRHGGRVGTRLTFKNSSGMAIADLFEEVAKMAKVSVPAPVMAALTEQREAHARRVAEGQAMASGEDDGLPPQTIN